MFCSFPRLLWTQALVPAAPVVCTDQAGDDQTQGPHPGWCTLCMECREEAEEAAASRVTLPLDVSVLLGRARDWSGYSTFTDSQSSVTAKEGTQGLTSNRLQGDMLLPN